MPYLSLLISYAISPSLQLMQSVMGQGDQRRPIDPSSVTFTPDEEEVPAVVAPLNVHNAPRDQLIFQLQERVDSENSNTDPFVQVGFVARLNCALLISKH